MKRISVTMVEKYRRYIASASPFDTEEALLDCITGKFTGNAKTAFGTAYHSIIEGQFHEAADGTVYSKKLQFTADQAAPALAYRREHLKSAHEVSVKKLFRVADGWVQVGGRADVLRGLHIHDAKTKFRPVDWQEYADSCQWKIYMDMLGASAFYYDVFLVHRFPAEADVNATHYPDVYIDAHESYRCDLYDDLHEEVESLVVDFMRYTQDRKLEQYLKPAL